MMEAPAAGGALGATAADSARAWPRITIVTPCFNPAKFVAETVQSVLGQNYPNLEYIVMDGGSTDGTLDILRRFTGLKVISEKDEGHSDATNKGFALATGDIFAFVNGDDSLLPGALERVAREIDPAHGRHVVMGRCIFTDENSRPLGIEHPCHFESHRRLLQIWKGHMIPQPSTFWTRQVWNECGPARVDLKRWMDFDLFVRMSKKYAFHRVDQVLATYRLHSESVTMNRTEADRLEDCIRISRQYWGSPLSPGYWRLASSLAVYRFDRLGRARRLVKRADERWRHGHKFAGVIDGLRGSILAPEILFYVKILPWFRDHFARGLAAKAVDWILRLRKTYPQTAVYANHTDPFNDGWVSPRLVVERSMDGPVRELVVCGNAELTYIDKPQALTVLLDGRELGKRGVEKGDFGINFPFDPPIAPGAHKIEIRADRFFVPHRFLRNQDYRPLAWRLYTVELK